MMSKQDEYRRNAEHAEQMAERVTSQEDKASWLRVATGWLSLLPRKTSNGKEQFDGQAQALGTAQRRSDASH